MIKIRNYVDVDFHVSFWRHFVKTLLTLGYLYIRDIFLRVLLFFVSGWCRRKRKFVSPGRSLRAARRARQISLSATGGTEPSRRGGDASSACNGSVVTGAGSVGGYNWAELQRQGGSTGGSAYSTLDRRMTMETDAATLVDGTRLSPQQLGLMGMEALETVVGYWEDALNAYRSNSVAAASDKGTPPPPPMLTTAEETIFVKLLENILEGAYQLQEESESIFIHQNSILNRENNVVASSAASTIGAGGGGVGSVAGSVAGGGGTGRAGGGSVVDGGRGSKLLSVSTVDNDSFVSAQDTIADLGEFDGYEDIHDDFGADGPPANRLLYLEALEHLDKHGIPYRALRTDFVGCETDSEYVAKLHCLRLAFKQIMKDGEIRKWWVDTGRQLISALLCRSEKDPQNFAMAYDGLVEFLSEEENVAQMTEELASRNVQCCNFYDIVLDYILVDSFEDLESPPSSVLAVMKNRWLSDGFKESALHTAIWSVLKAKRRLLKYPDGFKAQFYTLSEIVTPVLAWGFFGPDENLNTLMHFFKDQMLGYVRDLYSFQIVRYTDLDSVIEDVVRLSRQRLESVERRLKAEEAESGYNML